MAAIRIVRDTSVKGVPAFVGDIVEVDEADARLLVLYKLAEPYEAPAMEEEIPDAAEEAPAMEEEIPDAAEEVPNPRRRKKA